MSVFFDTNVLVYCTDRQNPAKQAIALSLVEKYSTAGQAVVSTQVLIELYNVLVSKQKVPAALAAELVSSYALWPVLGRPGAGPKRHRSHVRAAYFNLGRDGG